MPSPTPAAVRTLPDAVHAALLDVSSAALDAAEEREPPAVSLAYLEASIHRLGSALAVAAGPAPEVEDA
jgi:hypothetical protein